MHRTSKLRAQRAVVLAVKLAVSVSAGALSWSVSGATNYSWTNSAGGAYSLATNWTPVGGPPLAADTAFFNLNATYTVVFPVNTFTSDFVIENGAVTFNLAGNSYTLSNVLANVIGDTSNVPARLTLNNGTVNGGGLNMAATSAGTASLFVSTGASYQLGTGLAQIGNGGAAFASVTNGGAMTAGQIIVGNSASGIGTLAVSGVSSTVNATTLTLGFSGAGSLAITGGGAVSTSSTANFSNDLATQITASTASALVSGAGSTWTMAGGLAVGEVGSASVGVLSGGQMSTAGSAFLGFSAGSSGTVNLSGAGSSWSVGQGLIIGQASRGELDVGPGASLTAGSIILSNLSTGVGVGSISGVDAVVSTGAMTVGNNNSASLTVSNGAALTVGATLAVGDPAGAPIGVLTLDGGASITCGSFSRLGTFNFNDGTMTVRAGNYTNGAATGPLTIDGNTLAANPTLVLTGGATASNVSTLTVGGSRSGTLFITDHSSITVPTLNIGAQLGSSGTVVVGGSGGASTLTVSNSLTVGGQNGSPTGAGTLIINSNGVVNANAQFIIGDGGVVRLNGGSLGISSATVFVGARTDQFQWTSGTLQLNFTGGLTDFFVNLFTGPDHVLHSGQVLTNGSTAFNILDAPLTISGGLLGSNFGTTGSFGNSSDMVITGGGISTTGNLTNFPGGIITVSGNGTIGLGSSTSSFVNNGTVQLASNTSLIKSSFGSMSNNGTLRGAGNVNLGFTNTGQVIIGSGERMEFSGGQSGGSFTNLGLVSVIHGEAVFNATFNNSAAGAISGHDSTLRFNAGLGNGGSLLFTSGQSDVFGAIANFGKVIVSGGGTATFYNPITNSAFGELRVSTGATGVFFGAVNGPGSISGSGLKIFEGGTSSMGPLATQTGSSLVESSASITADNVREDALTLFGQFTVRPNGTNAGTSRLNSLLIDSGNLDLNDNDLVVDYTGATPFNTTRGYLLAGSLHSSTAAASTTPKTALGIAENSVLGLSSFSGQAVDATSILVKYTYLGDANLDGQVDVTDLGALATNWQTSAPWTGGDFNYDGFVDVTDLGALATNWQAGVGSPLGPSRFDEVMASVGLSPALLPEPAGILFVGAAIGAATLGARSSVRSRRKRTDSDLTTTP
jgi:T5SS/PEP-CTERM-associated repeat protein